MKNVSILSICAALLLSGCIQDQATLEFAMICAHPVPTPDGCAYPEKCELFEGDGRVFIDAAGTDTLVMQIQFDNQLPNIKDSSTGLLDGNDAVIEGFRLNYTSITPGVVLPFSGDIYYQQTAVVHSASSLAPLVYIVPPAVGLALRGMAGAVFEMRADLWARGHYKNGHSFEVGPFPIPVEVRNGTGPYVPVCGTKVPACCGGNYQTATCACVTST